MSFPEHFFRDGFEDNGTLPAPPSEGTPIPVSEQNDLPIAFPVLRDGANGINTNLTKINSNSKVVDAPSVESNLPPSIAGHSLEVPIHRSTGIDGMDESFDDGVSSLCSTLGGRSVPQGGPPPSPGTINAKDERPTKMHAASIHKAVLASSTVRRPGSGDSPGTYVMDDGVFPDDLGLLRGRKRRRGGAGTGVGGCCPACVPPWIANASPAIKAVIIGSVALFIVSLVLLVYVAVTGGTANTATNNSNFGSGTTAGQGGTIFGTAPPGEFLLPTPSPLSLRTKSPTIFPVSSPSSSPSFSPVSLRQTIPTIGPVSSPLPTNAKTTFQPTAATLKSPAPFVSNPPDNGTEGGGNNNGTNGNDGTNSTSSTPTHAPTSSTPSLSPSSSPSILPTSSPSQNPTRQPQVQFDPTTFYVITGRYENEDLLKDLIKKLPPSTTTDGTDDRWLVHLGDFNNRFVTECDRNSYRSISRVLRTSPVPTYIIPGDNEWNDCENPDVAWEFWTSTFDSYDERFWDPPAGYVVERQQERPENWGFVYKSALYVGLNLVDGFVEDQMEWDDRLEDNAQWIEQLLEEATSQGQVKVVILFGNAGLDEDVREKNLAFWDPFEQALISQREPYGDLLFVYVHQTQESFRIVPDVKGIKRLIGVKVQSAVWPPMRIILDLSKEEISFDQDRWFVD